MFCPRPAEMPLETIVERVLRPVADAYSYMAEYHLMGGDLPLAINQLELALSVPNLTDVQRSRFSARLQELREWLPKERARLERPSAPDRPSPGG